MNLVNAISNAVDFCRLINRSPVIFIGQDSYEEFQATRNAHAWTQKFCVYASKPVELLDVFINFKGLALHLESHFSPIKINPIAQHFLDYGAHTVFATNINTRKTVFFTKEVRCAAA